MNAKILALWNEYKSLNRITHDLFSVAEFGDSDALADRLADLIDRGIKTATCSRFQDYLDENAAVPEIGSYFMVVTSGGDAVCLCQVTGIRVGPFDSGDAAFAFEEGEDDRSFESWRREHRRFFGLPPSISVGGDESFLVVFERFRRVWPQTPNLSRAR